jgi:hypothetical protein
MDWLLGTCLRGWLYSSTSAWRDPTGDVCSRGGRLRCWMGGALGAEDENGGIEIGVEEDDAGIE